MSEEFGLFYERVGLKQNQIKSEILAVRRYQKTFDLEVGEVKESDQIKLLGLVVESNFRFEAHCQKVCGAARVRLRELTKVANYLPFEVLKRTVEALVLSKVYYALEIYGVNQGIMGQVQRVISASARLVCRGDMNTRISEAMNICGWMNSSNKTSMVKLMLLRKVLITRIPLQSWETVVRGARHDKNTRNKRLELTRYPVSYFSKLSVMNMGMKLYNELMVYNMNILSKSSLKKHLPEELRRKFGNSSKPSKLLY